MAKKAYVRNSDNTEWVELASATTDLTNYAPLVPATQTGFRNAIINGDFRIWQRGTSFSSPPEGTFVSDRWVAFFNGFGASRTFSREPFTLGAAPVEGYEGQFFLRYNQSVAGTAGTYNQYNQKIENVRTFAGQSVTVSFWAKAASSTVLPSIVLKQDFGTGGSPSASVNTTVASSISVGTSWTRFTYTTTLPSLSGKTIGTSNTDNLTFILSFPLNSVFTVDIWGVQVEPGTIATPFEQRPIGTELALCQRYYWRSENDSYFGNVVSAGIFDFRVDLPVEMRVRPVTNNNISSIILTIGVGATQVNVYNGAFTTAPTTYGGGVTISSKKGGVIRFSGGAGGTNGFAGRLLCGTSVYFDFDAEL